MSTELIYADATKLAELIRTREVSPVEVVQAHLDRIAATNPKVNAIVTVADDALRYAKEAEAAVQRGDTLGPLHGVPFTAKDSIDTAHVLTQRGSPIFRGRTPDTDATAVKRLKGAGAILLAKTNLPEFSYGIESDNLLSGRTNNPWNLEMTPAVPAAANRPLSPQACLRLAWALTWRFPCVGRRLIRVLFLLRRPMAGCR
jgi:aspartyl-tRNA(Asn)/glutamyl-tRNA(Gln) amidotransferase subunit A